MAVQAPRFRPKHAYDKRAADKLRGNSTERGYDAIWRRLRAWFLRRNPRCEHHLKQGISRKATVVDHIKPIAEAPELRLDPSNLRALCKPCHDRRTALEQGFGRHARGHGRGGPPGATSDDGGGG
jgi:5-methylcytosine-specific restriction protein A